MSGYLWGMISALGYGTGDFVARFTGKALGANTAVFGVFLTGSLLLSVSFLFFPAEINFSWHNAWLLALAGIANMLMLVLLFTALARGPISIAAPIVASHPALILVILLLLGVIPTMMEMVGLVVVILGVAFLSRQTAHFTASDEMTPAYLQKTIFIALAANVAYAVQVIAAQQIAIEYGSLQAAWATRVFGLLAILIVFVGKGERIVIPIRWWPIVIVHGCLDAAGVFALVLGSLSSGRIAAAVISSAFPVVTVLLASLFIKEAVSGKQWIAIAIIVAGVALISGTGG
ncbi:MAG: DMT family transporter [Gammaproteobacteria bacterium]|nr:DMT family transporter [Gammaproteobacteria bacterium]